MVLFVLFVLLLLKFIDGLLQSIEIYCFLDNLAFLTAIHILCVIHILFVFDVQVVDVWFILSVCMG